MGFAKNALYRSGRISEIASVLILIFFIASSASAQSGEKLEIKTLSSRPDLVSGGDALVEVRAPAGASLKELTLTLNGRDVTSQLRQAGNDSRTSSFRGLISGMVVGDNKLIAAIKPNGESGRAIQASLSIKNYPITGPILSGPHMKPYECRTVESALGPALDANCSAAQKIEYF